MGQPIRWDVLYTGQHDCLTVSMLNRANLDCTSGGTLCDRGAGVPDPAHGAPRPVAQRRHDPRWPLPLQCHGACEIKPRQFGKRTLTRAEGQATRTGGDGLVVAACGSTPASMTCSRKHNPINSKGIELCCLWINVGMILGGLSSPPLRHGRRISTCASCINEGTRGIGRAEPMKL